MEYRNEVSMSQAKKILMTGFEPFLGETVNPSKNLLRLYEAHPEIRTEILPVSYERSWQKIESLLNEQDYDLVLMLGQAGGRAKIGLERVAINVIDAEAKDEDGVQKVNQIISAEGPDAYLCSLPLREWLQTCRMRNFPIEISNSAGTYVCNSIYYKAMQRISKKNLNQKALFVHFPYLPEQVFGKASSTPCLTLEVMKQLMDLVLDLYHGKKSEMPART